jgi:hypothetical protein
MCGAVLTGGLWEEFSGEGGRAASVLNSSDLKHVSKLTVCVIYAFSDRRCGIRPPFTAVTAIIASCRTQMGPRAVVNSHAGLTFSAKRVKCMSHPECKCGPATRSYLSSSVLKHFHIMNKRRKICRLHSAVLWHCAKNWFLLVALLSLLQRRYYRDVGFLVYKQLDSRSFCVASINRTEHYSWHNVLIILWYALR